MALRAGAGHAQGIAHIGEPGRGCRPTVLAAVALEGDRAVGGRAAEGWPRMPATSMARGVRRRTTRAAPCSSRRWGSNRTTPLSQRATPPAARPRR